MHEHLFNHVDIPAENINVPNGEIAYEDIDRYCDEYEAKIKSYGGIDYQILGIGGTGHIGFNEPGSAVDSITRLVYLEKVTKVAAASDFGSMANVPRKAISMGVSTIM